MTSTPTSMDLNPARRLIDRHLEHSEPYAIDIDWLRLTVLPEVFCPAFTKTSAFLAEHVRVEPGESVLDVFSGSGYQGLRVARRAGQVTCVDWSEAATACCTANAAVNQVADRVTALTGDLFAPVDGRRFDVVIANPPLLPGDPATRLESAIFDPDLIHSKRFLEELPEHLTRRGRAYLIATDAHRGLGIFDVEKHALEAGLLATVLATLPLPYETYTVYKVSVENPG
ncbi:methyltransferase [Catenulispora sp. NL8]|uniref:Methyltransferase n=1 Tax=Catenulispora pinistramenti TaxID=2705254 RepID=A0ABS5L256_9ACTN|nr:methyltransferase [Catenulispora pinistramenti]MBS2552414.1 methyltransferase [Catenulispora pinistramenti]